MHLYIFGNGSLSFNDFLTYYATPLARLVSQVDPHCIVCDFRGVDTLAMEYLKTVTPRVSVYHIGDRPRYLPDRHRTHVREWQLLGGFETDASRDAAAREASTHFLARDATSTPERKSSTARNIEICLEQGKIRVDSGPF